MPPDELAVQMVQYIGDGEVAFVGRHLRVEQHLQQQIAEFLFKMRKIAALDGVEDFVCFFERVFADGIEGLFAIPWAAAGRTKPRHDGRGLLEQLGRARGICRALRSGSFGRGAFARKVHAPSVYRARSPGPFHSPHPESYTQRHA